MKIKSHNQRNLQQIPYFSLEDKADFLEGCNVRIPHYYLCILEEKVLFILRKCLLLCHMTVLLIQFLYLNLCVSYCIVFKFKLGRESCLIVQIQYIYRLIVLLLVMNKSIVLCVTTPFSYLSLDLQILVLENNFLNSDSNKLRYEH